MRRTLIVLWALLMVWPGVAAAKPMVAPAQTTVKMLLPAGGPLGAKLEADDEHAEIEVHGKRVANFYVVERDGVSPDGIDLSFGKLGRFEAEFRPTETRETKVPRGCKGTPGSIQKGWFVGELRFRGERGFIEFEEKRLEGRLSVSPKLTCDYRRQLADTDPNQATIVAVSPDRGRRLLAFGSRGDAEEGGSDTGFFAFQTEHEEGMRIGRVAVVGAGGAGLRFDHRAGTALAEPPAPFSGRARFVRHRGGANTWTGSLNVPLLGAGRVHFAGPGFRATLKADLPEFE